MEMDQPDARPAYQRVADDLRSAIAGGTYGPGDQLPTLADLTARYSIAVMTARDAIRQLTNEGIVVSRQGKGAYVVKQPAVSDAASTSELLDLFRKISTSVDNLIDRVAVVEQKLADQETSTGIPPSEVGD
jgi:GntR family transcriptional regulator